MWLLLHHSLWPGGTHHVSGLAVEHGVVPWSVEEHGRPRLHPMGTHARGHR